MGVDLPTASRNLLPSGEARAVSRSAPHAGVHWLIALAVAVAGVSSVAVAAGVAAAVGVAPWAAATALAVVAWAGIGRQARGRLQAAAWLFSAAAVVGLGGHLWWAVPTPVWPGIVHPAMHVLVVPPLAVGLGCVLALGWRPGGMTRSAAVDMLLLLLAAAAGVLRWGVEPLLDRGGAAAPELAVLAVLRSSAMAAVLPALLVTLQRRKRVPVRSGVLVLTATLAFAGSGLLFLAGGTEAIATAAGNAFELLSLAGWVAFAGAGLLATEHAASGPTRQAGGGPRDALRKLLVPGTALFLGIMAVDMGARERPHIITVAVVASVGAVLALRTAHAFTLVDRGDTERRQLAHTRALVDVTHSLAGTTDLEDTLSVISESARTVLGTRGAGIELMTDDGRELVTRAAVGMPADVLGLRFPVEGSFTGWVVRHSEPRATADASRDPFVQPQSRVFLGHWPMAAAPIRFRGETLGALFACIRSDVFEAEELELLGAMAEQAAIAIQNARLFEQVMVLSVTDPLTGLANRRQLERELSREFAAAGRGRELVAVIFDLDGFKNYNDAHGHLAGDEALQAFAATLQSETRAMNFAARYGGDEFVALLAGADVDGANAFIRRVRAGFRSASLALGRGEISVSAGHAVWSPAMERPDELLLRADSDLYRAKAGTRK